MRGNTNNDCCKPLDTALFHKLIISRIDKMFCR